MCRTSYVCSRSRVHEFDLVITERVSYCKFFISSRYRVSYRNAHANRNDANRNDANRNAHAG